jgi:hypothetical protein
MKPQHNFYPDFWMFARDFYRDFWMFAGTLFVSMKTFLPPYSPKQEISALKL